MYSVTITIDGRKTSIEYNGKTTEHKAAFIRRMTFNDLLLYLER